MQIKISLELDAEKPSFSIAMNRPCSGWNISSDLFYIDQRVFLHSRVGIAIVFTRMAFLFLTLLPSILSGH
jgi:hypothetical protein